MFDYLIVGAGFAGSVVAERLTRDAGRRVLLGDKRPHIGGNQTLAAAEQALQRAGRALD